MSGQEHWLMGLGRMRLQLFVVVAAVIVAAMLAPFIVIAVVLTEVLH